MLGVGVVGHVPSAQVIGLDDTTGEDADPYARERDAWVVLASIDGLGPIAFAALLARYGSGVAILEAAGEAGAVQHLAATPPVDGRVVTVERRPVPDAVATAIVDVLQSGPTVLARMRELGIRAVTVAEPTYPDRLGKIAMPPHVMFVRGEVEALRRERAVAIVGTRGATTAGRTTAGRIATALVSARATVVSGLAYGIDGAAHEATLRAGGTTVAVIGGGHDQAIPPGHERLAEAIVASGGAVISELAPDVVPTRGTFPRRNRIISGLSQATVVVEAPARSGALITASWAMEQGRGCYLVPGAIDARASAGCLSFLRDFAGEARIVAGIPQLIADLGFVDPGRVDPGADGTQADARSERLVQAALGGLGPTGSRVAAELVAGRATVDELVAATDLPVGTVLASLTLLERGGLAVGIAGRYRPAGSLLGEPARRRCR